jgi:hypothetical protein
MSKGIKDCQLRIEQVIAVLLEELHQTAPPATERPLRQTIALLHGALDTLVPLSADLGAAPSAARHASAATMTERSPAFGQQQRHADPAQAAGDPENSK